MSKPTLCIITGFGIVTADLPRLVQFYRDVLGFAAQGEERPIDQAEIALLGLSGNGRRQVMSLGRQTISIDQFEQTGRRGSESALFGLHKARGNRRPVRVGVRLEGCSVREAAGRPGSSSPGLKRSQAQQGEPVRMARACHQFPWALALAFSTPAAHKTPVVQEEP